MTNNVPLLLCRPRTAGHSLRLDRGSALRIRSDDEFVLVSGAVYVDSGSSAAERAPIEIRTPLGTLRDVGTQFEARLTDGTLLLRVREGIVVLDGSAGIEKVHAGSQLELDASGHLLRDETALHGPSGTGFRRLPRHSISRAKSEFLLWAARETGLQVLYVDAATAAAAPYTALSGSIEGLTPEQALAAVLPTCGLAHRIEDGTLIVQPQQES